MDIVLAAAIALFTCVLAYMGLHVTLHPQAPEAKNFWKAGFVIATAIVIVLVTCQTWRNLSEQNKTTSALTDLQKNLESAQQQLGEANKSLSQAALTQEFMKGQLSGLSLMVGKIGSNGDVASENVAKALRTIANGPSTGIEPPAIQKMTNEQLRDKVLQFAKELRDMAAKFEPEMEQAMEAQRNAVQAATSDDQRNKIWDQGTAQTEKLFQSQNFQIQNCCVVPAIEYRDELYRRLGPPDPQADEKRFPFTFLTESQIAPPVVNASELSPTADYLEYLAGKLPKK